MSTDAHFQKFLSDLLHPDKNVRIDAAHTLSKLADARAVPSLLAALGESSPALVQKAIYALGRIGDVRALPALLTRVGFGSREIHTSTNEALESFGSTAVPGLVELLQTGSTEVRVEVAEARRRIIHDANAGVLGEPRAPTAPGRRWRWMCSTRGGSSWAVGSAHS